MQRVISIKAKTGQKSSTMIWNLNIHCSRDHCFSHAISSKIQTQRTKESKRKEFKLKNLKLSNEKAFFLSCPKFIKFGKIFCQDKKKEYIKKKQNWKNFILATGDNVIEEDEKKRNNKKCYNCLKRDIFKETALNLQKTKVNLSNFYAND